MKIAKTVECPVYDSFRVQQVAGMFDVTLADKCRHEFSVELPGPDEDWQLGAIVGPSGSGKSTIAEAAYGKHLFKGVRWPKEKAIVDAFGDSLSIKDITHILTAVGFSSPPSWVKPYSALSNGERFRCDLARALLAPGDLVAFDEFTSVVDRTVAKVGSAAVAKAIRKKNVDKRFVAVTCHYDVLEWLEVDWWIDMASGELARRRLRRPEIKLDIFHCKSRAWDLFAHHHYLNANKPASSSIFVGCWDDRPTCCVVVGSHFGRTNTPIRRISRIVVLPDFQGVGIGYAMLNAVATHVERKGFRVRIVTGHPAMIAMLRRSSKWRIADVKRQGHFARKVDKQKAIDRKYGQGDFRTSASIGRAVVSAEFRRETVDSVD